MLTSVCVHGALESWKTKRILILFLVRAEMCLQHWRSKTHDLLVVMCDVVPALSLKLTNHNRPRERSSPFPGVLNEIQAPQHLASGVVFVARLEVEKMEKN